MQNEEADFDQRPVAEAPEPSPYRVSEDEVAQVAEALRTDDTAFIHALLEEYHAADQADLIEQLSSKNRRKLIEVARDLIEPEALTELEETVRDEVIELLEPREIAAAMSELEADDAAYLIQDLDDEDRRQVLDAMPVDERADVEAALAYPEETAGRLMQRDFIAVPAYWTVGQTIDYMRDNEDLPEDFYEIFVIDAKMKPIGSVPLNRLLRAKRPVKVEDIMELDPVLINATTDQEEVAYLFKQYDLISALVVNEDNRLLGVIMVDDVVDVIHDEAQEDILLLSGVSDASVHESVLWTVRTRLPWLVVNLFTAAMAASVIKMFDATIEQMVALAVLMPMVASMGGNAGTQALTVAVRALGTKELTSANALRTIGREAAVGSLNGAVMALMIGTAVGLYFSNWMLGLVIGSAMIVNLIIAAFAGVMVPLGLTKAGVDPAVASGVFVTTITDVVGFFAFLGLAALILL
ncbi:magnesium transporter [Iodidimonas sp. SYSU 1G8]|uniref:magnesium transporter n=1 Tax=Iodidimonas sp. SYSU 1G8 TaxID=3133967 RepID=UPI0031FF40DB